MADGVAVAEAVGVAAGAVSSVAVGVAVGVGGAVVAAGVEVTAGVGVGGGGGVGEAVTVAVAVDAGVAVVDAARLVSGVPVGVGADAAAVVAPAFGEGVGVIAAVAVAVAVAMDEATMIPTASALRGDGVDAAGLMAASGVAEGAGVGVRRCGHDRLRRRRDARVRPFRRRVFQATGGYQAGQDHCGQPVYRYSLRMSAGHGQPPEGGVASGLSTGSRGCAGRPEYAAP